MNILFVCSRNKWRSRTAEEIFKKTNLHQIRSAGTENAARIKISQKLIDWADLIFVMEKKHRTRIQQKFSINCEIIILEIFDEYEFMNPELIDILKSSVAHHIALTH